MKIKHMDRTVCKLLRGEIDEALKGLGEKYGVSIHAGNASFTDTNVTFKLEIVCNGENGEVIDKGAEDFKKYASMYGLKAEDLGKEFNTNNAFNSRYQICGLAPRSGKYPILARKIGTDKVFKFSEDVIKKALGYSDKFSEDVIKKVLGYM